MKLNELVPWSRGKKKEETLPDLFDLFRRDPFTPSLFSGEDFGLSRIEVDENRKSVTVRAEIPGMKEKDISVDYSNGALRIRGKKHHEKKEEKNGCLYSECSYGSFNRTVPLPENVRWDQAEAKYRKGVLTVTLPKDKSREKSNRIEVKVQ